MWIRVFGRRMESENKEMEEPKAKGGMIEKDIDGE